MLDAIADNEGLSASDMMRQLIRQRFMTLTPSLVEQEVRKQKELMKLAVPPMPKIKLDLPKIRGLGKATKRKK